MTKKILRLVYFIAYWSILGLLIGFVLLKKSNTFIEILLFMYGVGIFLKIIRHIFLRTKYKKLHKEYHEMFERLKEIHIERYKLYLSGDTNKAEEHTEFINNSGTELLECGMYLLKFSMSNQKEKEEINKIITNIKFLIDNIYPIV